MSLKGKLEENWPPSRVTAECGVCDVELLDTEKQRPASWSAAGICSLIKLDSLKHLERTDHDDLQVNINPTTPVREIEATITVND
jgi:hypothetical protein